jgi:hypothetical protein
MGALRKLVVLLALAALCAGAARGASAPATLDDVLHRPGPEVALIQGTSDYAAGPVRVTFLIVKSDGQLVTRPRAQVWVARSLSDRPLVSATATLQPVGLPGDASGALATSIYVANFRLKTPGKYFLVTEPSGGGIQGIANLIVRSKPAAPAVGSRAIPSATPTLATTHGDTTSLTTRTPPDRALLGYSIRGSLAAHAPFVVVFATPKFCTSRTCGPVVDVVDAVRKQFRGRGIRFIHVEIYQDNDPSKGPNRWVKEWHLPSEPWTFLVGSDGVIKARFEGAVSVAELTAAVRRTLL